MSRTEWADIPGTRVRVFRATFDEVEGPGIVAVAVPALPRQACVCPANDPDSLDCVCGEASESELRRSLDALNAWLTRYIHFAHLEQSWGVTLWIAATHLLTGDAYPYDVFPYLLILSAEKESGKTTLLDLIEFTARTPRRVDDVSPAALGRIMTEMPTVLIDEIDSLFGKGAEASESKQSLRGILNTGYRKGGVYTRADQKGKVSDLPTFGPKALSGIGRHVPDTVVGRSIYIRMERKPRDSVLPKARLRKLREEGAVLRLDLDKAVSALVPLYLDMDQVAPDTLSSRQQDIWEPLYAVAIASGLQSAWPLRAQRASETLTASDEESLSIGVLLLRDVRLVFGDEFGDTFAMHTSDIIGRGEYADENFGHDSSGLCAIDDAPWATYNRGRPISPRQVSTLLKAFGIGVRRPRVGGRQAQGYIRDDFRKAWSTYLPTE